LKQALGDLVKDVRRSQRLTDSAVCLVAAEGDIDMHLERLLRQHRQLDPALVTPRILEINPRHPLIRRLAAVAADASREASEMADAAYLLLDQARILEGETLTDPLAFSRRLSTVMERGLAPAAAPGA
jgi:molecular chaperone HtpG